MSLPIPALRRRPWRAAGGLVPLLALAALIGAGGVGCSQKLQGQLIANQRPTWAPVDTTSEYFYVYKLNWVGFDADGRVVGYQFVVDPPTLAGSDTPWVSTNKNERTAEKPLSCIRYEAAKSRLFQFL